MPGKKRSLFARWAEKIIVQANGCWLWTGTTRGTRGRYGIVRRGRRGEGWIATHIFAFTHFRRTPRRGFVLDHTCETRLCCNPWCLDEVRQPTNMARRGVRQRRRKRTERRQLREVAS